MQAGSAGLVRGWQSGPGGWLRSAVGDFSRQIPCCLATALYSWLPTSAIMLHTLCRLLMLYCVLLQVCAGGSIEHQHGHFRSERLQLQTANGALPPAAPTQSTGRAALGQWQPTLEVPRLPSGKFMHRCASNAQPLTAYIILGPNWSNASRYQPYFRSEHLTDAWSATLHCALSHRPLEALSKQVSLLVQHAIASTEAGSAADHSTSPGVLGLMLELLGGALQHSSWLEDSSRRSSKQSDSDIPSGSKGNLQGPAARAASLSTAAQQSLAACQVRT